MSQLRVAGPGRRSVRVTAVEGPVPPAVTVTVKLAVVLAVTGELTAFFSTLTSGHCPGMGAAVELLFRVLVSLLEGTLAVLLMPLVQSAAVVVVVKVMGRVLVGGSVPKVQVSVVPPA